MQRVESVAKRHLNPACRQLLAAWALLWLLLPGALAQSASDPIIQLSAAQPGSLTPAMAGQSVQAISIDVTRLRRLAAGDVLPVQLAGAGSELLTVQSLAAFINGGKALNARLRRGNDSYSLLLSFDLDTVYGHVIHGDEKLQIQATREGDYYHGWLFQPRGLALSNNAFSNDYLIPQPQRLQPPANTAPRLPLRLSPDAPLDPVGVAASTAGISSSNFRLSQTITPSPVVAGESFTAEVRLENTSSSAHQSLAVEIYFLLENTTLEQASPGCRAQLSLSLQEVLYCELGDFAPGETKVISYTVGTTSDSQPRVISTAIMGELRVDESVNVVEDVRLDSDGDGVSDFNEDLLGTDASDSGSVDTRASVIDVMAFYTPGAQASFPRGVETRINQLIGVANQIYADSGVAIKLRPVYYGMVDADPDADMDTLLDDLIYKGDSAFDDVDRLRDSYGGDLVMLFDSLPDNADRCGMAPVGGYQSNGYFGAETEKDFAYSYIAIDCPVDLVVAHELGHNMGLTHSHLEDGSGGTFNFATGHGVDSEFVTVMAYPGAFNTDTRLPVFSSPLLDCLGFSCGVAENRRDAADAVQTLNLVRHQIAAYAPSRVPELPDASVSAVSGNRVDARIGVAASTDGGLSYSNSIGPGQRVDLIADVEVDAAHVGRQGSVHVMVGIVDSGFLQLDAAGSLVEWDGTREGLIPATSVAILRRQERLTVLSDFQLPDQIPEEFIGQQVAVYVAYQVAESGDVVYTQQPLLLNIVAGSD